MKNSKITKIVYTIVVFLTTVFVFGQETGPTEFGDDVVDNAATSPIDDYIIVGIVIAVLFAIYSIQNRYFSDLTSIKKEQN